MSITHPVSRSAMKALSSGTLFFSLNSMFYFFLSSTFLSLSSSGPNDGSTGIYERLVSVSFCDVSMMLLFVSMMFQSPGSRMFFVIYYNLILEISVALS